jgi:hypothetical protein
VGGILEDTETNSLAGYPWLTKIPILKYLFAQEDKERQENEIVFAITPHIVRAQEVTDDNLRVVDLGRGNSVRVGHRDPRNTGAPNAPPAENSPISGQGHTPVPNVAKPASSLPRNAPEPPKTKQTAAGAFPGP